MSEEIRLKNNRQVFMIVVFGVLSIASDAIAALYFYDHTSELSRKLVLGFVLIVGPLCSAALAWKLGKLVYPEESKSASTSTSGE